MKLRHLPFFLGLIWNAAAQFESIFLTDCEIQCLNGVARDASCQALTPDFNTCVCTEDVLNQGLCCAVTTCSTVPDAAERFGVGYCNEVSDYPRFIPDSCPGFDNSTDSDASSSTTSAPLPSETGGSVGDTSSSSNSLSTGAVAGISVGATLAGVLIIGLIVWLLVRRWKRNWKAKHLSAGTPSFVQYNSGPSSYIPHQSGAPSHVPYQQSTANSAPTNTWNSERGTEPTELATSAHLSKYGSPVNATSSPEPDNFSTHISPLDDDAVASRRRVSQDGTVVSTLDPIVAERTNYGYKP